jgi:membrane-anchored protein YejM (alkaline phosphatase superfamily)
MPNIYAFSKKCEVYKHHYSGSNGTRTGVFSLFYSIPGTYWDDVLASKTGSIFVDGLQRNRYDIKTFASATLTNPPFDCTVFRKVKNLVTDTKGESVCDRDNMITNEWLQLTEGNAGKKDKPLFGFLFYDALHAICHPQNSKAPFQPEWKYPKYEDLNNNSDPRPFYNLYKNSAVYVDSLVGVVLRDMERRGLLKNSWVIITGDHGQEFNDNKKNFWGHNGNYTSAQMQVPLIVYKPNGQHKVYSHWTSHYDIVPTIFKELFHCKNTIDDFSIGKELTDTKERSWLLVGSKDNFAVLEPNKITSMYFDGSYDITDSKLNPLKVPMNTKLINQILSVSKRYYRCQ